MYLQQFFHIFLLYIQYILILHFCDFYFETIFYFKTIRFFQKQNKIICKKYSFEITLRQV